MTEDEYAGRTAIVGDVLSALQVPGSAFFGKLGDKYLERKQREAAEIEVSRALLSQSASPTATPTR